MSWLEITATVLGVINVLLIVRRNVWNYPFGIAMVILYGFVFFGTRLYSDAALQVFFLLIQIYGWRNWLLARQSDGLVPVAVLTPVGRLYWCAAAAISVAAEGWILARYTSDVAPWMDATTTVLSVVAQYLLSVRKLENWLLWIVADVIQIGLYFWKGLYPTTMLYFLFLILSVVGFVSWSTDYKRRVKA